MHIYSGPLYFLFHKYMVQHIINCVSIPWRNLNLSKHNSQKECIDIGEIKKEVFISEREDSLIQTQTLRECPNKPIDPEGRDGFVVIKVPVVLAEFEVEISSQSHIKFDQPAVEVLRVKKNVFLTECRLLPVVKKLFLKGFVRKNIEFAAKSKDSRGGNNIRHIIVEIPFICTTLIDYFIQPNVNTDVVKCKMEKNKNESQLEDKQDEELRSCEYLNERIYCEIVKARVFEVDINEDEKPEKTVSEKVIQELDEKLVIYITLRLLQKQEINIYGAKLSARPNRAKQTDKS